jgi:hypothetical protein
MGPPWEECKSRRLCQRPAVAQDGLLEMSDRDVSLLAGKLAHQVAPLPDCV